MLQDRLRGVLVLDGKRITLPPKPIPFENDIAIGHFVRDSAKKLRKHIADEVLVEKLAAQLLMQAQPFRLSAEALAAKEKREQEAIMRTRKELGLPVPEGE